MKNKKLLLILVIFVLPVIFFPSPNLNIKSETPAAFNINFISDLENHTPILIFGNAELSAFIANENLSGVGTFDSPYIIENYFINASTAHGIEIQSTDVYLTILNCTIEDSSPGTHHNGIYLKDTSNINLINNTLIDNFNGICLENAFNTTIQQNMVNESWDGILLKSSFNNSLNNNVALNSWNGINLEYSYNNTLTNNNFSNNIYGIYLKNSYNNSVSENVANHNSNSGIYVYNLCENNTFSSNIAINNSVGINIQETSTSNKIIDNVVSNNSNMGIFLYKSSNNFLQRNIANYNALCGIYLDSSSSNILENNDVNSNTDGINLEHSSYNTLKRNNASQNTRDGIVTESSRNNTLIENIIIKNGEYGFLELNSYYDNFTLNYVSSSSDSGIYLDGSDNSFFYNNVITSNKHGMILSSSSHMTVQKNHISNRDYGILIFSSNNNSVFGNNIYRNHEGITLWSYSDYNKIYMNSLYENSNNQANEDADCTSNEWDNGTAGNYWGDYILDYPGATNDGYIWSIPYAIDGSGSGVDNFPLVNGSINEEDNVEPKFSNVPADISEVEGYSNLNITWIITDLYPDSYTVELNGNIVVTSTEWISGIAVIYNIPDGLPAGEYNIIIIVMDQSNNIAQDSVRFVVIEQTYSTTTDPITKTSTTKSQTSSWPPFGIIVLVIATVLFRMNRKDK